MNFGMQLLKASGAVAYDSSSVTWNQVDFMFAPANGSVSGYFPVLAGREVLCVQIMIDAPPLNRRAIAHTIVVNKQNVTASGGSENAYILVLMR